MWQLNDMSSYTNVFFIFKDSKKNIKLISESISSLESESGHQSYKDKKTDGTQNEKKYYSTSYDACFESDGSMLDLENQLKPISSYINDRKKMLNEMFRCIKGAKLQAMIPGVLKVIQEYFKSY